MGARLKASGVQINCFADMEKPIDPRHVQPSAGGDVHIFDWGRLEWLISKGLGNSETMTFGRVLIKAGRANPRHRHPNCDEILHLLSGRLEHSLDDSKLQLDPGDTISIPAGRWHNARSIGHEDARMIIAFSSAERQTEPEPG